MGKRAHIARKDLHPNDGRPSGVAAELRAFKRLAAVVGAEGALLLVAWAGGRQLAVPIKANPHHVLCRLLGPEAFTRLVAEHGNTTIFVPMVGLEAVRRTGQVYRLGIHGLTPNAVAEFVDCTPRQALRIAGHLRADTPRLFGLDEPEADDDESAPAQQRPAPPDPATLPKLDALSQLRAARQRHENRTSEYADD